MIKNFLVSVFLIFSIISSAQNSTASPYSFYGIGTIKSKASIDTKAMGDLGILPDSIHINFQNPASYSSVKLTSLTFGGSYNKNFIFSNAGNDKATTGSIEYIGVGIPIGKFGASFGLMPYSTVGYDILYPSKIKSATGNGGVNRAYIGGAYQINKNFSLGFDFNYNFGTIRTSKTEFFENIEAGAIENNSSKLFGVSINTGIMYNKKINKKNTVFGSLIFTPSTNLTSSNNRNLQIIDQNANIVEQKIIVVPREYIKLPSKIAFGAGYGEEKKWVVGAEFTTQNTSSLQNIFSDIQSATFENTNKLSLGGYFIPKYNSFTNYFQRITYRGGFRYENTGLVINNQSINDVALTLGLGLPLQGFSNVNLTVEFGQKGTKQANLIQEKYINFSLSFSFSDRWFIKRKYD
jgi:hypothetical protein